MEDCIHRSKRAMRRFKFKDGRKCYKCTLELITIIDQGYNEVFEVAGKRTKQGYLVSLLALKICGEKLRCQKDGKNGE